MRSPFLRDVPPRAAAVVVALALIASVVTGAPGRSAPQAVVERWRGSAGTSASAVQTAEPPTGQLRRRKKEGTVPDIFVVPAQRAAALELQARAAAPAPPPAPAAPPLPFRYLGRMVKGERTVVFLEHGPGVASGAVGETVDNYRIESISASAVTFVYLPLGVPQTLTAPSGP
jgi:hypothetical protein